MGDLSRLFRVIFAREYMLLVSVRHVFGDFAALR